VIIANSTQQAANVELQQIQRDHFVMFGDQFNQALEISTDFVTLCCSPSFQSSSPSSTSQSSKLQPDYISYIQLLQYANMGCGFAAFESWMSIVLHHGLMIQSPSELLPVDISPPRLDLDEMIFTSADRIMRDDGFVVMLMSPDGEVINRNISTSTRDKIQSRMEKNGLMTWSDAEFLESSDPSDSSIDAQNGSSENWEILDMGPNQVLDAFRDRSVRYDLVTESIRRAQLFALLEHRSRFKRDLLDAFMKRSCRLYPIINQLHNVSDDGGDCKQHSRRTMSSSSSELESGL
jgi:hypothetical protein